MADSLAAAWQSLGIPPMMAGMSDTERESEDAIDLDLIQRIRQGDRQAQSTLYQRYGGRLLAWLTSISRNRHDPEDMAQEIWKRVFAKLDRFTDRSFQTWLFHIARNYWIDVVRKPQRNSQLEPNALSQLALAAPDSMAEPDPRYEAMTDCLQQLDSSFRAAIMRVKLNGESHEAAAAAEGIAAGTIGSRVSRGLKLLKECIERKLR